MADNYDLSRATEKVLYVQKIMYQYELESLNKVILGEEGDTTELGAFIPNDSIPMEEVINTQMANEKLLKIVESLRPREQQILKLRFGLVDGVYRSLDEVGKMYNLTRERVRQIESSALKALRRKMRKLGIKNSNYL